MEKRRGRPPKENVALMQPITIRFSAEMMDGIDRVRLLKFPLLTRSDVVRQLVSDALEMHDTKRSRR